MTTNPKIYEAFEEEAKGLDVQEMMALMMEQFQSDTGYTPTVADEIKIRKMLLAKKYIEKEQERLVHLKQAIMADWDAKIQAKTKEIESITEFVGNYVKNQNGGKKLSLDIGTITMRRNPPKVKLDTEKKEEAIAFLKHHNILHSFQKAPELDVTLLQNSYLNQFSDLVDKEVKKRVDAIVAEEGKITKKREGELKLEVERELAPDYFAKLPEFMKYIPEEHKPTITMK